MKYLISACGEGVVLGSAAGEGWCQEAGEATGGSDWNDDSVFSFCSEAKDEHGVCELRPALSRDCGIVCVHDNKNWELWTQPLRVWVHLTVHTVC